MMIIELEKMWKEVLVAYFDIFSWHSVEGTEENHKYLSQNT
jgi:hypothetical protein